MQDTIVTIYCLCDEVIQASGHRDNPQSHLSAAEVMTIPLVAAHFFGGHQERAQEFLYEHGYIHERLSKSRLNRRLHALPWELWHLLFDLLAEVFKLHNQGQKYSLDTMPFPVCDNIRIRRCRLFRDRAYRGKCASKRRYYYGFKVHLLITEQGEPVEFVLTPAAVADVRGLKLLDFDLPPGAIVHGDRAYNDYKEEDLLLEAGEIVLRSQRKRLTTRPMPPWIESLGCRVRQRIESTFSQLELLLPRHIHAVTPQGFLLKTICFLLALSIHFVLK